MTRDRAKVFIATLSLIVAGLITLYNVGVFDTPARRGHPQPGLQSASGTDTPAAGSLPVETF